MKKIISIIITIAVFWVYICFPSSVFASTVVNEKYLGTYYLNGDKNSDSYIAVGRFTTDVPRVVINAFYDSTYKSFFRGAGSVSVFSSAKFSAIIDVAKECDSTGMYYSNGKERINYVVMGQTGVSINIFGILSEVSIKAFNNGYEFIYDR